MNIELWTTASCTILAVTAFIYLFEGRRRSEKLLHDVPMPDGASLLWGHEMIVSRMTVGEAYARWMAQLHSQTIKIRGALFKPDILVVADPLAATHIMQRHIYEYPHSDVVRARIARLLGKSLGWVEGETEHRRMRNLVAPSLAPDALRRGTADTYGAAERLANNLETHLLEQGGSTVVSIVDWVNQATLEVIGRLGFGHDFGGGRSNDARKILGAWRTMANMGVSSMGFMALMMLRRFPTLNSLRPLKALRVQGDVRETIHEGVAKELLRRNANTDLGVEDSDLLTRLISAHNSGSIERDELMDHISMFIIAGSETTAQSLAYAIWELARNPHVQTRLRKEAMGYHGSPSYDDLQTQLPYLDAVTREVLRLHPAAPYMERVSLKEDVLPLRHPIVGKQGQEVSSIAITAGQMIFIPITTINTMCSVWGDGKVFRPDRWMDELPPKELCSTGWSRMLTFSDGPRTCIGYKFAIFQFKVILLTLVRRFEFKDTGEVIIDKVASSLQPVVQGQEELGPQLPVHVSLC
ncbi:cytochrome P450 [Pisolithus marmoratus]|nr:cytochrome P450 [Pisolithus marmoratus]KAI6013812.1 cytochrome P450 [Pisolithus marmoratus]